MSDVNQTRNNTFSWDICALLLTEEGDYANYSDWKTF